MSSIETLQRELEIYRRDAEKAEENLQAYRTEMLTLTEKYLESMNRVLESQSEIRALIAKNSDNLNQHKDKCLIISSYIESLKEQSTLDEIRKIKEFFDQKKDLNLYDFIYTTKRTVKFLVTAAYVYATTLVAFLIQLIIEIKKGG